MKTERMKMKFRIFSATGLIGGLSVCSFTHVFAIEPPPDNAQPPAALLGDNAAPAPAPVAADNLPFMGLSTASVPEMVADHLGIESGTGVIIRTVCPDSPAHKAGLSENDIILSLDGTAVGNPEAFSAAIRGRKVGERMKVDLIHKGKPAKVEVTLTERPAELNAQLDSGAPLDGIPQDHADRLRGLIEQNLLQPFGGGHPGAFPDQQFENTFRMMRERMNRAFEEEGAPSSGGGIGFQQNSTIRLMDSEGSVEIKSSQGATDVTVRGTDNTVVWSGPWNTDKEKEAAPKEIRDRIDRVNSNSGSGFSFHFGKLRSDPDTIDN
jgi:serine protease Do